MIYAEKIFLHISNGSEIPSVSILKLFVGTFVSFEKEGVSFLNSNGSKYRKIWRTRLRTFSRMVGEYGPSSFYI